MKINVKEKQQQQRQQQKRLLISGACQVRQGQHTRDKHLLSLSLQTAPQNEQTRSSYYHHNYLGSSTVYPSVCPFVRPFAVFKWIISLWGRVTLFRASRRCWFRCWLWPASGKRQLHKPQGTRQGKTRHSARDKCADAINRVLASPSQPILRLLLYQTAVSSCCCCCC